MSNKDRTKVFVAQRIDSVSNSWQLPQGGIEDGEKALSAMYRELEEETNVKKTDVEMLAEYPGSLEYKLPADMIPNLWGGKFCGQVQQWFLVCLNSEDQAINIHTKTPEFSTWKWQDIDKIALEAIDFKRDIYIKIAEHFKQFMRSKI